MDKDERKIVQAQIKQLKSSLKKVGGELVGLVSRIHSTKPLNNYVQKPVMQRPTPVTIPENKKALYLARKLRALY